MKKFKLLITLVLCVVICATTIISTSAKSVKTVKATYDTGAVTVSGTTESGMLACAVMVYDESGKTLKTMETCQVNADNTFSMKLATTLDTGKYVVKVADYDGGTYAITNLTVAEEKTTDTTKEKLANTTDDAPVVALIIAGTTGLVGMFLLRKKF